MFSSFINFFIFWILLPVLAFFNATASYPSRIQQATAVIPSVVSVVAPAVAPAENTIILEGDYAEVPVVVDDFNLSAESAIVIDKTAGKVPYQKNAAKIAPIASITKLMSALVFLDTNPDLEKIVTIQKTDFLDKGVLYGKAGEKIKLKDLFFTSLVGSINNATAAYVHASGITDEEFIARMNYKADELGMSNTVFADFTGLNANSVSTAYDVAQLANAAFRHPLIKEALLTKEYKFQVNSGQWFYIKNTDQLLQKKFTDFEITGAKTGYTEEAKYTFTMQARNQEGRELVIVVLAASTTEDRFNEAAKLAEWAFGH